MNAYNPTGLLLCDWKSAPLSCFALVAGRSLKSMGWGVHGVGVRVIEWAVKRLAVS